MLLTFRRSTFCCIHQCWTKHPGYTLRECLYDFIDCCLYIVYTMYVSMTKPACHAFSAWLNTGYSWSLKVTGKAIMLCSMTLRSKFCAALHSQSNVSSMCYCKPCRSLDLSILMGILSGVDSDYGAGPRGNGSVNWRSTLRPIERRPCWPKTFC